MIDSFLNHLQYEKRLSHNTVVAYQTDLQQVGSFLRDRHAIDDLSHANHSHIRAWIVALVESGIGPSSVNRKIACMRTFFKFLMKREKITKDPMARISVLKTKKRLPVFVKQEDMVNLLDNRPFPNTFEGHRDRLILEMFYGTGIRLSELINLKENSVDLKGHTIKVLGKRNKERIVPFSRSLVPLIKDYLTARNREVELKDHGLLFVKPDGEPCYPVLVNKVVKKYLDHFPGIQKRSPHVLRHTYATHLLDKGAELNAVKDLLGHTSLAATQVYTHNSVEKLKKVFDQAHPKA